MDASAHALARGARRTRLTLSAWNGRPWPVVRAWLAGSVLAALGLLATVWLIARLLPAPPRRILLAPPFAVGSVADARTILGRNLLVLALHALACVAGFIAGSELPEQAPPRRGPARLVHEHGGRLAIGFVALATAFSLATQAWLLGRRLGAFAQYLGVSPGLVMLSVLPHALPELIALFLPLSAWIIASRRAEWGQLLAATVVTSLIAVPILYLTALVEVFLSPRLFVLLTGIGGG